MFPRDVNPQTQCLLFSLPAEIRNDIYTRVLTVRPESSATPIRLSKRSKDATRATVLSLLQTCALVYQEACGLFYSAQPLALEVWFPRPFLSPGANRAGSTLLQLSKTLNQARLTSFRNVTLEIQDVEQLTVAIKGLRYLPKLQIAWITAQLFPMAHFMHFTQRTLNMEAHFIKLACAQLPKSLDHLHFSVCDIPGISTPLSTADKQDVLDAVLKIFTKPLRHRYAGDSVEGREDCQCLRCRAIITEQARETDKEPK